MFNLSNLMSFVNPRSREVKIGIIGLDQAGKYTVLQCLNEEEIRDLIQPEFPFKDCKTGKSRRFNMKFVMTYVGCSEKPLRRKWLADQFCDSDGIIFVIDDNKETSDEAAEWMESYAHGFNAHGFYNYQPAFWIKVREGIPWLILGNQKQQESWLTAKEITQKMRLDSLNIDSHVEVVNILTGEGVEKAITWLRKRVDIPMEERKPMKEVKFKQEGQRLFS